MGKRIGWLWLVAMAAPLISFAAETSPEDVDAPPIAESIPRHPLLQDRFRFALGGFYTSSSTTARLDANTGLGAEVNFEDSLGLDERKLIGEASMHWRFAKRWQLNIDYFSIKRDATRVLSEDVKWGDLTFTLGSDVKSQFKISDLRVAVGYSFFQRTDKELGLGFGLHVTDLEASLEASSIGEEAADVSAPLPVLTLYNSIALTDTWAMSTHIDWLSLSYDDYDGDIRSVAIDFLYQPYRHVGFGIGWHGLTIDVGVEESDWRGNVRLAYHGPAAFMSFSF